MFDGVASRYDLTNALLSFGQDRRWRIATRRALNPKPAERILDLAAGTAVSTMELRKSGATCIAADFSMGMLSQGRGRNVPLIGADATKLPFADNSFDAVTISFGLRNVNNTEAGLREMMRVVRPGGRLAVCEFSTPTNSAFRAVYMNYLMKYLPEAARRVSSNPDAYVYLAESIQQWPDQAGLTEIIHRSGWEDCTVTNLTGGISAIHTAFKPV